ncbi:hypothetical protein RUM43_010758 [Polyplax serrata]|uniref:Uncharacterized protein n=1 Tax=Polyplax serrata TaxID=468196 RepID=A0AAN8P4I3_POLSC
MRQPREQSSIHEKPLDGYLWVCKADERISKGRPLNLNRRTQKTITKMKGRLRKIMLFEFDLTLVAPGAVFMVPIRISLLDECDHRPFRSFRPANYAIMKLMIQ